MSKLLDDFRAQFGGCSPSEGQWRAISRNARTAVYKALILRHSRDTLIRHVAQVAAVLDTAECEARCASHGWAAYLKAA